MHIQCPSAVKLVDKVHVHNQGLDIVQRLPLELRRMIHMYVGFPIEHDEAKKIRYELRGQRSKPVA
jgi:hypothetical protein